MRVRPVVLILAAVAVASACGAGPEGREERAGPAGFTAQDEAAIRALADSAEAQILRADWSAWAMHYTEDAVLQPANEPPVKGRAAMEAWARKLPPVESFTIFDEQLVGSGDLAYYASGLTSRFKDAPDDTLKQLLVFRRTGDGWRAVAASFSSNKPPAPTAASRRPRG